MMYYGFYNANEFVDRSKLDIPEVRLSSVSSWNDPMTMDSKLVLIDVHYDKNQDDPNKIHEHTIAAIIEVLARYGVEAYHKEHTYKLYYKDSDKDVKFFSTSLLGGHYYYYINIGHDYNGALDYSNDPNTVPRNDPDAYGLKANLPDTIITEIIERYAELYGLPLMPRVFTPEEEAKIAEIEIIHNNENWIVNGKRDDVWRLTASEQNEPGFEFDITLATKPDTNVYTMSIETKGLIFGKQDAIPDDKAKTEYRSPRITNSYAVYHDSKQGNEYKSGKAFHIYRPVIKDATGWEVWGDLDIDTETYRDLDGNGKIDRASEYNFYFAKYLSSNWLQINSRLRGNTKCQKMLLLTHPMGIFIGMIHNQLPKQFLYLVILLMLSTCMDIRSAMY
mgnify:CR=1 FL=1